MNKILVVSLDQDDLYEDAIFFIKTGGLSIIKRLILTFQFVGGKHVIFILPRKNFTIIEKELEDARIKLKTNLLDNNSVKDILNLVDKNIIFLAKGAIFDRQVLIDIIALENKGLNSISLKPALPKLQGNSIISTDLFLISSNTLKSYNYSNLSNHNINKWITNNPTLSNIELNKRFYISIKSKSDVRLAEKGLLKFLRKSSDPFISRTFNRPISLLITRLLMNTSITPNMVTMLTLFISLISIYFIFQPGYIYGVVGAFLLHTASVVDGCDGELARLKYQYSNTGELLDSLVDDFKNGVFIFGIGISLYYKDPDWVDIYLNPDLSNVYLYGAIIHAISFITAKVLQYKTLFAANKRDVLDFSYFFEDESNTINKTLFFFRNFIRSDFLGFFVLVMAILNLLPIMYALTVPAIFSMGVVVIIQTFINRKA